MAAASFSSLSAKRITTSSAARAVSAVGTRARPSRRMRGITDPLGSPNSESFFPTSGPGESSAIRAPPATATEKSRDSSPKM
ncbi:hypothetical protein DRJ58_00755 [Candidatus Acetothermia bacterium]|nr:MAG: hypothetical protein DRJ27_00080 [Candidatus Acetothermia bacterium]RLE35083.1 MAG: hypothetical protein DRJ58_00755 [Candidatus Acetothermia bacterium]